VLFQNWFSFMGLGRMDAPAGVDKPGLDDQPGQNSA